MKVIHTYLLFLVMIFTVSCVFGQNSESIKEISVKMYSNSLVVVDRDKSSAELFHTFSPSISWGRKYGTFQEVELTDFKLSFKDNINRIRIGTEYSYNQKLNRDKIGSKVNFFIGAGARVSYENSSFSNLETNGGYSSRNYRFNLNVIPRMTVNLGKRAFLDVSFPYSYYQYELGKRVNYLSSDNKKSTVFPNQFTVKVGVAFKF